MSNEDLVQKARLLGFLGRGGDNPPKKKTKPPEDDLMTQVVGSRERKSLPARVWGFVRSHRATLSLAAAVVTAGAIATGRYFKARQDRPR